MHSECLFCSKPLNSPKSIEVRSSNVAASESDLLKILEKRIEFLFENFEQSITEENFNLKLQLTCHFESAQQMLFAILFSNFWRLNAPTKNLSVEIPVG